MTAQPLIFFSGMGADERVFGPQLNAFPTLAVPRWLPPLDRKTLPQYAARLATEIDPGQPFWIGGASMGGMVALEVARRLPDVLGCFLIGSVRSPSELPRRLRVLRPATRLSRCVPFEWLRHATDVAVAMGRPVLQPATLEFLRQAGSADPGLLRWACRAVLTWEPSREPCHVPVHQIHGDSDFVLPWRLTRPDVLVRGGGHVLSLSHPAEVNDFIRLRIVKKQ